MQRRNLMSPGRVKKSKGFEQRYISVSELAARWSVSASGIYSRKCGTNALTPIRLGRAVRFLRAEVEALERRRETRIGKNLEVLHAAERVNDDEVAA
jgi:predicted DNA-binding transcriptional regulator AlpA